MKKYLFPLITTLIVGYALYCYKMLKIIPSKTRVFVVGAVLTAGCGILIYNTIPLLKIMFDRLDHLLGFDTLEEYEDYNDENE